tara:strand:- start:104313 stop:104819 length:507 start_codon:yes stop_codon:yes gene_type:complete
MTKRFSKIALVLVFIGSIWSCKDSNQFDEKPFLEYRGYELVPDEDLTIDRPTLVHELYFTDGDGDIGDRISQGKDTCSTSYYDISVKFFKKVNGQFEEIVPNDPCKSFYANHLPDLSPTGSNKVLEGTIYNPFDIFSPTQDSVKFEFILMDRSGNQSNIVTTPSLIIE